MGEGNWAVLLAYVLALEKSGGAGDLAALERLMNVSPDHDALDYQHEQAYFSAPEAWAKIVVRSGKFAEYARAHLGPDGAPQPSILFKMLMSKDKPLLAAAALRAMAIARDSSFQEKPSNLRAPRPACTRTRDFRAVIIISLRWRLGRSVLAPLQVQQSIDRLGNG